MIKIKIIREDPPQHLVPPSPKPDLSEYTPEQLIEELEQELIEEDAN